MLTMYDDTNLGLIPADAPAVAGYVNGRWATYSEVVRRWPHAHHLSIAVTSHADAECLDVEPGDATNDVAAVWVRRQLARGVRRPVVYTSVSNAAALASAMVQGGITRRQYRLWTAHYTGRQHLCGPACGYGNVHADATQWTDRSHGRSLDETVCSSDFFGVAPRPKPAPAPRPARKGTAAELRTRKGFYAWLAWYLGEGDWKPYGAKRATVRPNVPKVIAAAWWVRERAFLKARA